MNTVLWICQVFLCIPFLYSGIVKSTRSEAQIVALGQTGVTGLPLPLIRFIGISELLGIAGIILPRLVQWAPILTPITASCFGLVMIFATYIHWRRREYKTCVGNVLLLIVSVFVAVFRFRMLSLW